MKATSLPVLSDDARCVLMEMNGEHSRGIGWVKASSLSGPIGKYQARAFRELLRRNLVIRKRGGYANRYRRWLWKLSDDGMGLASSIRRDAENRYRVRHLPMAERVSAKTGRSVEELLSIPFWQLRELDEESKT